MDQSAVKRTSVTRATGEELRVYFSPADDCPPMPSVSEVKALREDAEKAEGLQGWREQFDGSKPWRRPHWDDQRTFKAFRGTLIHFTILSELGDASGGTYFHDVGESDWGYEEYRASYHLHKWSKKAPSANDGSIPYVPQNNQYDGEHAWDKAVRDMTWAARTFKQAIIDGDPPESVTVHADSAPLDGRFSPEHVIDVEEYVYCSPEDLDAGYGGQYDLLYETPDGQTVLSDLKTSSALRFDHKLQSAAYKRAVEAQEDIEIDETEIIRLHPDKEVVEVSRSPQWDRTLTGLGYEFLGLVDTAHVEYADALHRAREQLLDDDSNATESAQATDAPAD